MINILANALKAALNRANANSLPSALALFGFGDFLRASTTQLRAQVPVLDAYGAASNTSLVLPDDAKCGTLIEAWARAGTGTLGPLVVELVGATLSAGQCAPSADGNIIFYATDAWTSVDVRYTPKEEDIFELTLAVVSGVATFPAAFTVCDLLEVQRNDTSTAQEVITKPAASNSTTGTACLDLGKLHVLLDSADAATSIRVKFGAASAINRSALLENAAAVI